MAYSPQRLAQARQLFSKTTSNFYLLSHLDDPYHTRERAAKRSAFSAAWQDSDEDDNFAFFNEQSPTKRKRSLFYEDDREPRSDKRARSESPASTFRSRLYSNTDNEDHVFPSTPSHYSEPDSWDRYWAVKPETETPNSRYSFRRRNKEFFSEPPQKNDKSKAEAEASKPTENILPADNERPLRGCDACKELGLECSLASDPDPFAYPCITCEVDGVFCVVSPPPKWKRSCESCKGRRKELCSYRHADYDHSQPCLQCLDHGFECVAGPARHPPFALFPTSEPSERSSSPKIDPPATSNSSQRTSEPYFLEISKPSSSPEIDPPARPNSPHGTQEIAVFEVPTPCQQPNPSTTQPKIRTPETNPTKTISWELPSPPFTNTQSSVVEGPKPHEVIIIPDSDDDAPHTPEGQNSLIYISDSVESPIRTTVSNTIASQSVNTHRIWTELAHPVVFLADEQDGSPPCHWCNNFAYGINGLGPRNPEVWVFDNGTIVELQDGHIGEGKEQSRMCVSCAWDRCKIIQCSHNTLDLLPLPLSSKTEVRTDASIILRQATEALIDSKTGKAGPFFPSPIYEWCSLCREPAFGSCQTVQPVNAHAEVVDCDEECSGCGLMLCERCLNLTKQFKGDLNAVVEWGRAQSNPISHRADVEYLLSGAENNTMYKLYMEER
ncbi:hypothetical protein N7537_001722 [Penicillium hordei]|uniref:Zn(2)-C6 fungal-type domain-containing protein n=1 Tax=Penicillium hordei TaxID=40994 RepID=A0AAD6EG19_9EURO|nr:uncharacterized protein N7537_001722 [Penicillium hordei]KAJ5616608.1 hypothetical protein N7537_001722 [Penicillium hordei]